MNMKKTIAAVAACAVATSAMATTVFADDTVTLKYNLTHNKYITEVKEGSITYSTQIEYLSATADGGYVQIEFKDISGDVLEKRAKWTVSGNTINNATRDKTFSFVNFAEGTQTWELNASSWVKGYDDGTSVITIPIDDKGIKGSSDGFTANVSVTVPHTETGWVDSKPFSARLAYVIDPAEDALANLVVTDKKALSFSDTEFADAEAPTLAEIVEDTTVVDGTYIKYDINGDGVIADKEDKTVTEIYAAPNMIAKLGTVATDDVDTPAIVLHAVKENYVQATTTEKVEKYPMFTTANTVTGYGNDIYQSDVVGAKLYTIGGNNVDGSANNILDYLSTDMFSLSDKNKSYVNVVPVINDVIANYDDVTFTFLTAADGIKPVKNDKGEIVGYQYAADGDKTYMEFTQHLYNLYGDEASKYVYSSAYDWDGYNLWAGALIVNGNLTMSLQDTNVFSYGASTLAFNWSDATEGATVNTYATYLTKLQLATSSLWFWDSLEVTGLNTEAEDVKAEAGVEADEDVIEEDVEEDVVEEDIEEDVVEEDVVEDVVVDEPVVEDVPVVENPGTGNAPVALAVIPVALAAAAVVAKKRG